MKSANRLETLTVLQTGDVSELILTKTRADHLLLRRWLRDYLFGPQLAEALRTLLQLSERRFRHRFEHDPDEPCRECESRQEMWDRLESQKRARQEKAPGSST